MQNHPYETAIAVFVIFLGGMFVAQLDKKFFHYHLAYTLQSDRVLIFE